MVELALAEDAEDGDQPDAEGEHGDAEGPDHGEDVPDDAPDAEEDGPEAVVDLEEEDDPEAGQAGGQTVDVGAHAQEVHGLVDVVVVLQAEAEQLAGDGGLKKKLMANSASCRMSQRTDKYFCSFFFSCFLI